MACPKRAILLAALIASGLCASSPAWSGEGRRPSVDGAIQRWADGPVRYLMTTREDEALRRVKGVTELSRYIRDFWARRDPTPGTLENEYRREYWARVLEANRRFRDSTIPGWKTDRGKIFILLGEPQFIQGDENPRVSSAPADHARQAGSASAGQRGIERWTYRRGASRNASAEFVVAFVRDESLDWRLSGNDELIQPSFPGTDTNDGTDPSFGGMENRAIAQGSGVLATAAIPGGGGQLPTPAQLVAAAAPPRLDSSIFANYDLGLELSVPSVAETAITMVEAREFFSGFSASARFEFFRAQDGATFVNVGVVIPWKELYAGVSGGISSLRVHARLVPSSDPEKPLFSSNEAHPVRIDLADEISAGGLVDVWTGLALPPGRYRATIAVEDSLTGRLGRATAEFEAPDLSVPRLSLSTLVLASSVSQAEGRLGVIARPSGAFRADESFGVYYEVYGLSEKAHPAGPEESRSEGRFDVTYRFFREEGSGFLPIGKPIDQQGRTEPAQGWTFPLAKWPAGRYRLEVTVTDGAGQSVSAQAPFEVLETAPVSPGAALPEPSRVEPPPRLTGPSPPSGGTLRGVSARSDRAPETRADARPWPRSRCWASRLPRSRR